MIQKTYSTERVNFAACLAMTFFGVAMLSLGVLLPQLVVSVPQAVGLPPYLSVGVILGTILFGPVMDRFGYKTLLIVSTLLLMLGLVFLVASENMNILRAGIFLVGFGGGVINGETNALVSDIYNDDKRGRKLSILGACYCIGALVWTLASSLSSDFRITTYVFAAIMFLSAVFFVFVKFPSAKLAADNDSAGAGVLTGFASSFKFLKYRALVLIAIVLFFQSALEGTNGSFTTSFLTNTPDGLDIKQATLSLTVFTIGMMLGRFALAALMKAMSKIMVLNLYMIIGVVGMLLLVVFPASIALVFLAMALVGFGIGATYPVMLGYLGSIFRRQSGAAFSITMFIALLGQFIGNYSVGKLFTINALASGQYKFFPIILALFIFAILVVAPFAVRASVGLREESDRKGLDL